MGSNVLIGFRDTLIASVLTSDDNLIKENVLGGYARYPLPEASINVNSFRCPSCKCLMNLMVQLYCPVVETDRFIHIFACCKSQCSQGDWLITRTVVPFFHLPSSNPPAVKESKVKSTAKSDDAWFDDQEEWTVSIASSSAKASTETQSHHQGKSKSTQSHPKITRLPDELNAFEAWYIAVEDEADLKSAFETGLETSSTKGEISTNESGEVYEKSTLFGSNDPNSSRFWKKLNKVPNQIIRYNLDQEPLLHKVFSDLEKSVKPCDSCKSPRRFEMQLMPALISILRPHQSGTRVPEFATVLVYTCSKDCSPGVINIEQAIVLEDPDLSLVNEKFKST